MSQFKIYGHRAFLDQSRESISGCIHEAAVAAFKLPTDKRFHRFIGLDTADLIYPEGRTPKYLIIEVAMFEGRTREAKKEFFEAVNTLLRERAGLGPNDLEITIDESPKENWFIRGHIGDELQLTYKVEV